MLQTAKSSVATQEPATAVGEGGTAPRQFLPRPESLVLLAALLCTAAVKWVVVFRQGPAHPFFAWVQTVLPDVTFFSALFLGSSVLYAIGCRTWFSRIMMLAGAVALAWSAANAAWMLATGIQLQPGILSFLVNDAAEYWPMVKSHLHPHRRLLYPAGAAVLIPVAWFLYRFIRPLRILENRRLHARHATAAGLVLLVSATTDRMASTEHLAVNSEREALAYSSHWYAMTTLFPDRGREHETARKGRIPPREGQRWVGLRPQRDDQRPNIVLLFLESVPYSACSLADPDPGTTPYLKQLARQGTEFISTHVPVPHTTKAFWAGLTGSTPDLQPDYIESILVDEPYESLATMLRRAGYRSGFFQMSKGYFECSPGLFSNLGFDWAWFRENLEDPSAYLSFLNGDDFRMIDPALDWATADSRPFLLTMITSVTHHPFEVPRWFGKASGDQAADYILTLKYTDAFIRKLDEELTRRGLDRNTILCIMGDHGTSFRNDTQMGRWVPYEEVIRVPWIIRWPGRVEAGRRIPWPCSQLDLTPTLLALVGFEVNRAEFEGRNALIADDASRRLRFAAWEQDSPMGVLEGSDKWIFWPYHGKLYYYNLAEDPGETMPRLVSGGEKDRIVNELLQWREASRIEFPAKRFRERLLFGHWKTMAAGRIGRSYYVQRPGSREVAQQPPHP